MPDHNYREQRGWQHVSWYGLDLEGRYLHERKKETEVWIRGNCPHCGCQDAWPHRCVVAAHVYDDIYEVPCVSCGKIHSLPEIPPFRREALLKERDDGH